MTIKTAITELKKKKNKDKTISSEKAKMYSQNIGDILYWLFQEQEELDSAIQTLVSMKTAQDWTLDEPTK